MKVTDKQEIHIIHPIRKRGKPGVGFWTLQSFLKSSNIDCRLSIVCLDTDHSPDIAGVIGTETIANHLIYLHITDITFLHNMTGILSGLKKNSPIIIVGGDYSLSLEAEKVLDTFKYIDIIVRAPETEKVLARLIKTIFSDRNWETVKGITYRHPTSKDKIVANKNWALSGNLDFLSNLGIYEQGIKGYEWYPIIISRGCDNSCRYCCTPGLYQFGHNLERTSWIKKTAKKVVDEIEFLISKGICQFSFYCDRFFGSRKDHASSVSEIADEILKRQLKVKFTITVKAGDLKKNLQSLPILKEAGLDEIQIGIDSGIPRFHEMYSSGSTVEDCIDVLRFMHENRYKFNIVYIFYDPFLTINEIKETIAFLYKTADFFSHLDRPYSAYLDSRILTGTLVLRHGMPVIQSLKENGILVEYPGYSAQPAAVFSDPSVKKVYSVYSAINGTFFPKIRHFFYDKKLVEKYGIINLFPLRVLEKICDSVIENKFANVDEYVADIESFMKDTLGVHMDGILSDFSHYRTPQLET